MLKITAAALTLLIMGAAPALAEVDPYLGEISQFGGYCPNGWLPADGRTLVISQYSALFSLLGTYYGGDGNNSFKLPNYPSIPTKVAGQFLNGCIAVQGVYPSRN